MSIASLITHGMLGSAGVLPPEPFDTTSVHANILDAVDQVLAGLGMQKAAGGYLKIYRRFSFTPDWARDLEFPCVAYGPAGVLAPSPGGPINRPRKDTLFPLTIRILAHADRETAEQQVLYLAWIQAIRDAIERPESRLGDYGIYGILQPGLLIEPDADALNILSLVLTYQVLAREGTVTAVQSALLTDDPGTFILNDSEGVPLTP